MGSNKEILNNFTLIVYNYKKDNVNISIQFPNLTNKLYMIFD